MRKTPLSLLRSAAALALLLAVPNQAPAARAPGHDGVWAVTGTTDVGSCAATFAGEVTIRGDEIIATNAAGVSAIGAVGPGDSLWARLTSGDGVARASGRFHGATASGAWSSNTALCGGRWSARRKG